MNILIRVYFSGGVVAFTILAILLSIANPSGSQYTDIAKWAFFGAMVSCVPILVAIEGLLVNKKWLKVPLSGTSNNQRGSGIQWAALLIESFVIALFCVVCASLIVSSLYGDEVFRSLIINNETLLVLTLFSFSVVLSSIMRLVSRKLAGKPK